jgi:hypothetical protein
MRSMGEGHRRVFLTFWRGDTLNVPLHHPADGPPPHSGEELNPISSPFWGGINVPGATVTAPLHHLIGGYLLHHLELAKAAACAFVKLPALVVQYADDVDAA